MGMFREFTVEGSGAFPLDMLRYDGCYPVSTIDALKIDGAAKRQITLRSSQGHCAPTSHRWASFNWRVI